jgi:hypothetical protein
MRYISMIVAFSLSAWAQLLLASPNLVPAGPNRSPDYFCTWNLQGYVCSYANSSAQRREMVEQNLFGHSKCQDWIDLYPSIRGSLFLVLDDSWDVPLNGDKRDYGSLILNRERFPSYDGTPAQSLRKLSEAVRAKGWRGLGGWVCAQQAPAFAEPADTAYWTERMHWMRDAGISYWKVDWGSKSRDAGWRQMISELGAKEAPNLVIEHALAEGSLGSAAVYRTYDVENIIAAPTTVARIAHLLHVAPKNSPTLINCEDEPYIAAGTGSAIGVMRHPFTGPLPNGRQDFVFPPVGRDLKRRLDEVVRGVNWHRIARPIPLGSDGARVDDNELTDTWTLNTDETWMKFRPGDRRIAKAPARIARGGLSLPEVEVDLGQTIPYVLASRSQNGPVAIAVIGRTLDRSYVTPKARVTQDVGHADTIGVFGAFGKLTLRFDQPLGQCQILAQDLAGSQSVDITPEVSIDGNALALDGVLISKIGLAAASHDDLSEPGLVMVIKKELAGPGSVNANP